MSKVALVSCPDYAAECLEPALDRALSLLGGLKSYLGPGQRVLIKPNLLSSSPPEKRVTTDPALLRAVTKRVLDLGARPFIADSPALDSARRVSERCGAAEVARELGVELAALGRPVRTRVPEGGRYQSLELSRDALEADAVINLPKLKTHSQMLLTLGVKNLFGTVVAQRKAEWHLMAGADRENFAALLLDIWRTVRPALTILDGVWGMEGLGPSNGQPRHCGLLAASPDALALDLAVCRLLGVPLRRLPLWRAAGQMGLCGEAEAAELVGDEPERLAVPEFMLPELGSTDILPRLLSGWSRRHLVSKPVQDPARCQGCGKCVAICPASALTLADERLGFDYDRCIRCYCCQEVCPEDAIGFSRGLLARVMGWLGR